MTAQIHSPNIGDDRKKSTAIGDLGHPNSQTIRLIRNPLGNVELFLHPGSD
jgi:hypothetical protein